MAITNQLESGPSLVGRVDDPALEGTSSALDDILAATDVGLAIFDGSLTLLKANEPYRRLCGYSVADLAARPSLEQLIRLSLIRSGKAGSDIEEMLRRAVAQLRATGGYTFSFVGPAGVPIQIHRRRTAAGRMLETVREADPGDVAAGDRAQMLVDRARARMAQAMDAMADGFVLFDANDRLVAYNQKFVDLNPYIADVIYHGVTFEEMTRTAIERDSFDTGSLSYEAYLRQRIEHHRNPGDPMDNHLKDGRWIRIHEKRTSDGGIVGIRTDITELKNREAEILQMSEELRQRNMHFDVALNNMVQGLCMFDENQTLMVVNRRYLEMYGFSSDVVKPGITLPEIMRYSVSIGNYTEEEAAKALAERPQHAKRRERATLKQYLGDGRVIAVMHQPMPNGGSIATYQDITDIERHEAYLRDYTRKLEISNRELQDFAYIASHDLQEPLRKIEAFGDRLKAKFADQLPKTGQDYIDRMRNSAARMRLLISDLLGYSQVTTKAKPFARVNLNEIMDEVVSDLQIKIEELGGQVRYSKLPEIEADSTQLRQLLQNLVHNALKFHKHGTPPSVDVSSEIVPQADNKNDPRCRITVADNGIGFDNKYKDQIFTIFQRLHGRNEYEGTGIGLSTCRKIVERHSGTIDADGRPDEGAKLVIELPVYQNKAQGKEGE